MRTSIRLEIDKFDKRMDQAIAFFDKAGRGNPYHDERGRFASGPGGGKESRGSKDKRLGRESSSMRRIDAQLSDIRERRRLEAARQSASKALDDLKKEAQSTSPDTKKVGQAIDNLKTSQERLKQSLQRAGDSIKGYERSLDWFGLAVDAMVTIAAINIAGTIHPALGGAAVVMGIGYMAYRTYKTLRGRD